MAKKIWVRANEGEAIPLESNSKEHITHQVAVEITETPYYSRLLSKKALVKTTAPTPATEQHQAAHTKPKKAGGK